MRSKIIATLGAFVLSAAALQAQATTSTTPPVDINTASRTQLADAGWGQYADAIIAKRPYKSMNDLVEKKVVPTKAYEKGSNKFQIGKGTTVPQDPNASSSSAPVTPQTGSTPSTGSNPSTGTMQERAPQSGGTPSTNQPGATAAPSTGTSTAPASGASNYPSK